jgi:ParB-like nuclease domain
MKIAVSDLRPNPFRHLERYPINRDKIDALKESIRSTEFWDNLVARKAPNGGGGYEIAYGHHRYVALKEMRIEAIDIPVRKLDDTTMAKIMAHENMEEWSWSALIEQETLRAIVEGFAEGRIELPKVKTDGNRVRYAPSFLSGGGSNSGRPELGYSATSLSKFLGWNEGKVEAILSTLAVIEKGLVKEEDLEGLSTHQAEQVTRQTNQVQKRTGNTELAKRIGKELAVGMRSATGRPGRGGKKESGMQAITYHGAPSYAAKAIARETRATAPKAYPPAGKAIPDLATKMLDVLSPESTFVQKVEDVIAVKEDLHPKDIKMLVNALRGVAKRATRLADRLEG